MVLQTPRWTKVLRMSRTTKFLRTSRAIPNETVLADIQNKRDLTDVQTENSPTDVQIEKGLPDVTTQIDSSMSLSPSAIEVLLDSSLDPRDAESIARWGKPRGPVTRKLRPRPPPKSVKDCVPVPEVSLSHLWSVVNNFSCHQMNSEHGRTKHFDKQESYLIG